MRFTIVATAGMMIFFHLFAPKADSINTSSFCSEIYKEECSIHKRFPSPIGFVRSSESNNSYTNYLRNLPLKVYGSPVLTYDGREKPNNNVYCSVIDMDIDPVNLQQCADAVMRLRGEYLFEQKRYNEIHFEYLSDGKAHYFINYAHSDISYKTFRKYMKVVFNRANTRSLKNELIPVTNKNEIRPGDVFIVAGKPFGHAIMVMDVVTNEAGEKQFLLGQSYMPAQETHILINPACPNNSPWFSLEPNVLETPEWNFEWKDLHRFPSVGVKVERS